MCKRTKFKKEKKEQLELGKQVLVASYKNMSTEKYMIQAVEKAFRPLTAEQKSSLPDTNAFVGYLKTLTKAISEKKCPINEGFACNSVLHDAYFEIVGDKNDGQIPRQISAQEIIEAVNVPDVCDQERVAMESDDDLLEDFDVWRLMGFNFIFNNNVRITDNAVLMDKDAFIQLLKEAYKK